MLEDTLRAMIREEVRTAFADVMKTVATQSSEHLTVREAATIAKVTEKTIRNWLAGGELKTYHAGRLQRVDRAELERFMSDGPKAKAEEQTPEQLARLRLARKVG